jgi:hypothetical protein
MDTNTNCDPCQKQENITGGKAGVQTVMKSCVMAVRHITDH